LREAGNVPDPGAMTMLRPPSLPCFAAGLLAAPAAATSPASARGRSPGLPPSPSRPQAWFSPLKAARWQPL